MVLVPRFLQLGAVAFELKLWTDARAVSLAASWPGGRVLAYALGTLWHQPPDDRIALLRAGATITDHVGVYAAPTNDFAERDLSDFANGCMNWLRIAGALPSLDDSYQVGTNFLDETLVIPRPVFIELVTRMVEIEQGLANGTTEPKQDDAPAPKLPAPPPEVLEYERRRVRDGESAKKFAVEVIRGEPWTPSSDPPDETDESEEPTYNDEPEAQGALIPSYLHIGSAYFPLQVRHGYPGLRTDVPGMEELATVIARFREMPAETRERELSSAREYVFDGGHVYAGPAVNMSDEDLTDGSMNWYRLTGEFPRKQDSYLVAVSFRHYNLMIPQDVFFALIRRLVELDQGVANGTIELRLADALVPPQRATPPELTTYDRLRSEYEKQATTHALKVMRGEPWTPLPELTNETYESEEPTYDDDPEAQEAPIPMMPASEISTPITIADASMLRQLERMVIALDELDLDARGGGDTYEDPELEARCAARRQRVLIELEVAGLFERSLAGEARAALAQLPALRAYHDAAMQLYAYLESAERAEIVRKPRPNGLLDSDVSIDWFRCPTGQTPEGMSPQRWLALVEREFESPPPFRAGRRFTRLEGHGCTLLYRTEARTTASVWRGLVE